MKHDDDIEVNWFAGEFNRRGVESNAARKGRPRPDAQGPGLERKSCPNQLRVLLCEEFWRDRHLGVPLKRMSDALALD